MVPAAYRAPQPSSQVLSTLVKVKRPAEVEGQELEPQLGVVRADKIVAAEGMDTAPGLPEVIKRPDLTWSRH